MNLVCTCVLSLLLFALPSQGQSAQPLSLRVDIQEGLMANAEFLNLQPDAKGSMGPPKFKDAVLMLTDSQEIEIKFVYL
jgi:hypothetical protein